MNLYPHPAARITEGALLVAAESNGQTTLFGVSYIMQYSCLFALLLSMIGFIGMAYVVCKSILFFDQFHTSDYSGQHTYSENPRVATILRLIGLLALIGLALCIAGGVLGLHTAANQVMAASLRRAGVCLYAAVFLIMIPVHIGAWTYRWHLRSYRRSVSFSLLSIHGFTPPHYCC